MGRIVDNYTQKLHVIRKELVRIALILPETKYMIRISKLADYAVVILAEMARDPAVLSATAIASATTLPETTVAKVLKSLAQGNLLTATRGAAGGYAITKSAAQITVREIIETMDGPVGIVDCTEESRADCQLHDNCKTKTNWSLVNDRIRGVLSDLTLAHMMQQTKNCEAA